jgi:hypothetical protein
MTDRALRDVNPSSRLVSRGLQDTSRLVTRSCRCRELTGCEPSFFFGVTGLKTPRTRKTKNTHDRNVQMASIAARTAVREFCSVASWSREDDRSFGEDTIRTDGTTVKLANLGESVSAQYFLLFKFPIPIWVLADSSFLCFPSDTNSKRPRKAFIYRLSHLLFLSVSNHGQPEPPA